MLPKSQDRQNPGIFDLSNGLSLHYPSVLFTINPVTMEMQSTSLVVEKQNRGKIHTLLYGVLISQSKCVLYAKKKAKEWKKNKIEVVTQVWHMSQFIYPRKIRIQKKIFSLLDFEIISSACHRKSEDWITFK